MCLARSAAGECGTYWLRYTIPVLSELRDELSSELDVGQRGGGQLIFTGWEYCWLGGTRLEIATLPDDKLPREHVVTSTSRTTFTMASQEKVGVRDICGQQRDWGRLQCHWEGNRRAVSECPGYHKTAYCVVSQSQGNGDAPVRSECKVQVQVSH